LNEASQVIPFNEDHRRPTKAVSPALLKAAGHDSAKAAEILIDAPRKDAHARIWIKRLAASRRSVLTRIITSG
jgi:hypothetical protein